MRVAVLGAGLIGQERITALQKINREISSEIIISGIFDIDQNTLSGVVKKFGAPFYNTEQELWNDNPDWIFICLPHHLASEKVKIAIEKKINVLVEKPLGLNLKEAEEMVELIENNGRQNKLYVGFNYRFFEGVNKLLEDVRNGIFGKIISVNMILGHGNAPGMENSWKLNLEKCGGGCLIDPGVHLLDLARLISNSALHGNAQYWNGVWNTGIEEEVHLLLVDDQNTIFNLQVSIDRWRSMFRIEVNGSEGYGVVEGRGRSYGPQTYRRGKKWGWLEGKNQAESEEIIIDNSDCSSSFFEETKDVLLMQGKRASTDLDALEVMRFVEGYYNQIYEDQF